MAKNIKLTPDTPPPAAEPLQVPPPAQMPAGVTSGRVPLPPGRPVSTPNMARLTEQERKTLKNIGWREGDPIPENMAEVLAEVAQERTLEHRAAENIPPVDPSTPPVVFNPVDIETLAPAEQQKVKEKINAALQAEAARGQQQQPQTQQSQVAQQIAASRKIDVPLEPVARPAPAGNVRPDPNWRNKPQAEAPPSPQRTAAVADAVASTVAAGPEATAAWEAGQEPDPRTAAATIRTIEPVAPMTHCPHCAWDLTQPDTPEPSHTEKTAFLACILGSKSFLLEYQLLGGALTLTFRTLTTKEIDACFKQAYAERERGVITNDADFWERVNRFRLYLQLSRVKTQQFDHEMPDGLSKLHNPKADAVWEFPAEEAEPLLLVEKWMLENVLTTEVINRVVLQNCGRFNRVVNRLESLVDNESFWKATGPQS